MATPLALAMQVANRVNMREVMLAPMADFASSLVQLAGANVAEQKAAALDMRAELVAMYGMPGYVDKPFAFANGIAVIPIHGSLINRFSYSWGFVTGYQFIQNQLRMALDDDDVKAIIFDCNSPGGEVTGLFETCDEIFLSRGEKPLIAMIDTASYSACYALASSCDRMILTPSGGVGSIGAVCMHISVAEALKMDGIKVTPIYSGSHKIDGTSYMDLPESVRIEIQQAVDESRDSFVSLVSRNTGLSEKVIFDTEAACYRANEALALGLVHEIATPSQAAITLINDLDALPETEDDEMLTDEQKAILAAAGKPVVGATADAPVTAPAAAAPAPAAATPAAPDATAIQQAERARCLSITGSAEGKANTQLAQHLAFNTQMSADEAVATLKAAGPAAVAAPTTAKPAENAEAPNAFAQAMNNGEQPNVGADLTTDQQQQQAAKPGANLLAALSMATGQTYQ